MSRHIDSNGKPEPLAIAVIEKFIDEHINYRLEMLRFAEEILPAKTTRDSAFVEAAIVSGRLLLEFLGLGIIRKGGLKLVEAHKYHKEAGCTDEVKIVDVGGRFVDVNSLDATSKDVLAHFYNGASKAAAHFTYDSGHQLDLDNLKRSIHIIRSLVVTHLPRQPKNIRARK